ncbi:MAG TPA: class I SAM-dependent methyltransferase [Chloroflexota bacterium]|nr:class I SAM-dependent methyltransferase [Chloroflexota bacterium]
MATNSYNLAHAAEETRRLLLQAGLSERSTLHLLEDAGITSGMRVLDIGTGAGDVALLAARLVGPTGSVVGIDRNADLLALARQRALEAGLTRVEFAQADLHALPYGRAFDALVGRLVLCHLPDPSGALRRLRRHVRQGGLVVMEELNLEPSPDVREEASRASREYAQLLAALTKAEICPTTGMRLFRIFRDAGLEAPFLSGSMALGCRPDWPGFAATADTYRTLLPLFERFGLTDATKLDVDTMAARLYEDVERDGVPFVYSAFIGAWVTV